MVAACCGTNDDPPDAAPVDATTDTAPFDTEPPADARAPSAPFFEDVTAAAGIDLVREPREGYATLADRMGGGVCVIDVDGASPLDLFFTDRAGGSRLYVGRGYLDYADETAARGLDETGDAMGCLASDLDGDGDDDLVVTGLGSVRIFRNDDGGFSEASEGVVAELSPDAMYMSAAAGDLDDDGDVDLVVAGYQRFDPSVAPPGGCGIVSCEADVRAQVPVPSLLLTREDDGRYRDSAATLASGVSENEPTLMVAIADFDGDYRADVLVGNDLGSLFHNRVFSRAGGGAFADRAEALGLAYNGRGYGVDTMGWSMGDIDADGDFDHVMTSFESDPTAIFVCSSEAPCEERGIALGMDARTHTFRWGAGLFDVELDGDLDLIEATGHIFSDDEVAEFGFAAGEEQAPNLFLNDGLGFMSAIDPQSEDALGTTRRGRGIAIVDLDDDGLLDVVIASAAGRPLLLRNVTQRAGHYLRVVLEGRAPNTDAIGAELEVTAAGRTFRRAVVVGQGYLGNFDPRLHVGLPPEVDAVDVVVRWASGSATTMAGVAVDEELVVRQ
jgi:hypothetical protein